MAVAPRTIPFEDESLIIAASSFPFLSDRNVQARLIIMTMTIQIHIGKTKRYETRLQKTKLKRRFSIYSYEQGQ